MEFGNAGSGIRKAAVATLWLSLVLIGLMAGFFYSYSVSVMVGLDHASDATFIEGMQQINANIQNTWFGIGFFGALIVPALGGVMLYVAGMRKSAAILCIATVLYALVFLVTMTQSVPLNDQLAEAGEVARMTDMAGTREAFEGDWNFWNNIRTVINTLALVVVGGAVLFSRKR